MPPRPDAASPEEGLVPLEATVPEAVVPGAADLAGLPDVARPPQGPDGQEAAPAPAASRLAPRPRVTIDASTRRSRVLVLLRLPLAVPHLLWLSLWAGVVVLALPFVWLVVLVRGRLPRPLHRLLRAFARYVTHLNSFLGLAANPFPGFLGTLPYPFDLVVGEPARQRRLGVLLRLPLALPALVVLGALDLVRLLVLPVAWCIALVTGRLPAGLVEVLAYAVRYQALTLAYVLLLTARYPTFGGDAT